MSVHPNTVKFVGSAGTLEQYYREDTPVGISLAAAYYDTGKGDALFEHVRGQAPAHLPGLDLGLGMTRGQFEDFHNGRWGPTRLVRPGFEPAQAKDEHGKP